MVRNLLFVCLLPSFCVGQKDTARRKYRTRIEHAVAPHLGTVCNQRAQFGESCL